MTQKQDANMTQEWDTTFSTPESSEFLKQSGEKALKEFNSGSAQSLSDFAKEFEDSDE